MKIDGCSALITGASAGIGREFARQLATRARTLVLVARREQRLNELRDELRNRNAQLDVHVRAVDLCRKSQIDDLIAWLDQNKIDIDFLINNAGLGDYGSFATSDPQRDDRIIQVNIVAPTLLTRLLLPQMVARKRGAILNVSSSAGFLPIPGMAVYAASKAYVNSFTEALRAELRGTGVAVTALCPGPVDTEFGALARRSDKDDAAPAPGFLKLPVEQIVREGLNAVDKDRARVVPGWLLAVLMFITSLVPIFILRTFITPKRRRVHRTRDMLANLE